MPAIPGSSPKSPNPSYYPPIYWLLFGDLKSIEQCGLLLFLAAKLQSFMF